MRIGIQESQVAFFSIDADVLQQPFLQPELGILYQDSEYPVKLW